MEIKVTRTLEGKNTLRGDVHIDGDYYGYSLEDTFRGGMKVPGQTSINPGRYEVKPREEGGMHKRYCAKYDWHRGMLWLQDVDNYEWIYIHNGVNHEHTKGCILVGLGSVFDHNTGDFTLVSSLDLYKMIALLCYECWDNGEKVYITVDNRLTNEST